ncbi:diguanylate cyclase (GGDEF) domain-containing protein [Nitrosomonas cryotolerans]|uniref:Diguanylate cyclase/phosphodiesterase n=1 Tax=Nitrosomonas cryotolerans ATCC 49181 TaxID=1131553 RepID=A0A1N6JKD8_9PROT|nr:GGDEF domain-containing protein [Nitrosomonas cryotolerans]SFQ00084.1 diguanylate cyclase (GGDEF) domain-containing protein [Nitrosomonas cryotolerans]SIO44848.1 diguanylate cyclase/phosphodiesterase [Nitrosomonas cryotolerans ATCC 49181]
MTYPADESNKDSSNSVAKNKQLLTRLERVTGTLRTLSAGNHILLHASDEQELLHDMCQVIVKKGGYRIASVAYAQHDKSKSLQWMASIGVDKAFLEALHFTWTDDTETGRSAAATVIRTGQPCVGRHILTDPAYAAPAYAPLRENAIKFDYAAVTAFPLHVNGQVLGALVMGAIEPDAFDEEEVKLLSELADNLAYGISNLRIRIKHQAAEATIARLAYYDPLTELPNRTFMLERLKDAIHTADQRRHALALLYLNIGHLRGINQVLGYDSGDQLLQQLAQRLTSNLKESDFLARAGESEFALLLPSGGADYAIQIAQRLAAVLRNSVKVAGLMIDPRVSIGIAFYPGHAAEAETLLRRANAATNNLCPARGGYALYTGGQEQECTRRLSLMGDLRKAIEQNELLLYCQPKVDIASRRVCGAEALVRWQHPVHGMLATMEFIKLAENAALITPLTHWMLDAVFSQSYAWREAGQERALSVNLSAHDLYDPLLIDRVQGLFSTWGVRPELIQFELTESALMEEPSMALEALTKLKKLGIRLFIDDFGTGYSSLSYLQKLPVDSIKIDQSFVMPMVESNDSAVIVRSTIELGHNLDMEVVAEGVDSQAVWDLLATLECDVAQGYLMSMPMPAEQFSDWESEWEGHLTKGKL